MIATVPGVGAFDHVRWIGGGSGGGKTSVAVLLSERFGLRLYSSDATIHVHSLSSAPLLDQLRAMSMDERWVRRDPLSMYRTFPWFHGEGFELVLEDLRQLPDDRPVIAEGFRLLPRLVRPHLSDVRHAAWLLPTPAMREAAFARRGAADAFWKRTGDPDRALANVLERDRIFTDVLAEEAAHAGVGVVRVDGTRSVEDLAARLAGDFGLSRASP